MSLSARHTRVAVLAAGLVLVAPAAGGAGIFPIDHPAAQPDPHDEIHPVVAAGAGGHLVAWRTQRDGGHYVVAARVDAAGVVLDPHGLELGAGGGTSFGGSDPWPFLRLAAAWTGSGYLVVWANGGVYARTVSPAGVLGPMLTLAAPGGLVRAPVVACGGNECLVAWWRFEVNVGHRVRLARVVGDTVVATEMPVTQAAGDQHEPAIAWDGGNYLVAWRDIRRPDGGDIYAARVTGAGTVLDPTGFVVSAADGTEEQPAMAWNGASHVVVWRDSRAGAPELRAARVSAAGTTLDPGGAVVAATAGAQRPSLAWNGAEHLVAWSGTAAGAGTFATRLDALGAVVGGPFTLVASAAHPGAGVAAGAAPGQFLVAWPERFMPDLDVFAQPLGAAGLVPGARFRPAGVPSAESHPAAASDGTNHLLVWEDTRHGARMIYGTRVSGAGVVLDGDGFAVSGAGRTESYLPAVAWGDDVYLVVWATAPAAAFGELLAARVSASGEVLDPTPIVLATGIDANGRANPALAWNGSEFFVVWRGDAGISDWTIYGLRVRPDGGIVDAAPIPISRAVGDVANPAVAWSGQVYLVVWEDSRVLPWNTYGARVSASGEVLDADDVRYGTFFGGITPAVAGGPEGFLVVFAEGDPLDAEIYARRLDPAGVVVDADAVPLEKLVNGQSPLVAWDGASYRVTWVVEESGQRVRTLRVTPAGALVFPSEDLATWPEAQSDGRTRAAVTSPGDGSAAIFFNKSEWRSTVTPRYREMHLHGALLPGALNGTPCAAPEQCSTGTCAEGVCCDRPCPDGSCATGTCTPPAPDAGPGAGGDGGVMPPDGAGDGGGACGCGVGRRPAPALAASILALACALALGARRR